MPFNLSRKVETHNTNNTNDQILQPYKLVSLEYTIHTYIPVQKLKGHHHVISNRTHFPHKKQGQVTVVPLLQLSFIKQLLFFHKTVLT